MITHFPAATAVKVVPTMEHVVEVVLKVTGAEPSPFVALNVCVPLPIVIETGSKPVMVCATLVISMDLVILVSAYLLSVACEAVITHIPAAKTVKVVPAMEHTVEDELLLEKMTGAVPSPFVALNVCVPLFAVIELGLAQVMVCTAFVITMDLLTLTAE